ncbi:hypothetical protein K437DRAFT_257406 [Tilletiaria anomala UBC 951]|uniref:Uncharacterized protein n=1 Tax=Tilletiaria anomala (strain ATCC 24038 / CBS 436.72 / UBC 951) TaxID=1037660 RepID=A0A066VPJ3_TILAU|nr:uncharacterized protein K437DRAFT_257406 [Tilletiaria anomala UBC 951]KDN43672.1 hypothetical protein K437DRAFT_257406 [Tilletiaria anomala UBC 951]
MSAASAEIVEHGHDGEKKDGDALTSSEVQAQRQESSNTQRASDRHQQSFADSHNGKVEARAAVQNENNVDATAAGDNAGGYAKHLQDNDESEVFSIMRERPAIVQRATTDQASGPVQGAQASKDGTKGVEPDVAHIGAQEEAGTTLRTSAASTSAEPAALSKPENFAGASSTLVAQAAEDAFPADAAANDRQSTPAASASICQQQAPSTATPASGASNASSGPPTPTLAHATASGMASAPRKFASASVTKKFLEKASPSPLTTTASPSGTLTLSLGSGSKLGSAGSRSKLSSSSKAPSTAGWAPISYPAGTPSISTSVAASSKLVSSLASGRSASPGGLRPSSSSGIAPTLGTNVRSSSPAGTSVASSKAAPWTKGTSSPTGANGIHGLSSREADRLKTVFPTAAEAASAQKEAEKKAAAAAAEALAKQEAALKVLESFRGGNLKSGDHWDDLDDDEFFGEVVEFGDGKQYKITAQPTASVQPGEAAKAAKATEKAEEQVMQQEVEANFYNGPVSKEERFRDVGHDRTMPSARPPPWGGIKRGSVSRASGDGEAAATASFAPVAPVPQQQQKQLFDAKAATKKERRISVGAPSISLLQRDRAPSESFVSSPPSRSDEPAGMYNAASAQAHAPVATVAAATRAWGPLAQRQASLNKASGVPVKAVVPPPTAQPPAEAKVVEAPCKPAVAPPASELKTAKHGNLNGPTAGAAVRMSPRATLSSLPPAAASAAAVNHAQTSSAPRPPPWGGIKRSLEGQSTAPEPSSQALAAAAPAAAPPESALAAATIINPEDQAKTMLSAVERARKRREDEEARRLEEKERARAKAAALEAKLKEEAETKERAKEEAEQKRKEALEARRQAAAEEKAKRAEAAAAEKAEKAREEAAAAAAAATKASFEQAPARILSPSDAISWRRSGPSPTAAPGDVTIAKRWSSTTGGPMRESQLAEQPRRTLLQRTLQQPIHEQPFGASTRPEVPDSGRSDAKRRQQAKATIPRVDVRAPSDDVDRSDLPMHRVGRRSVTPIQAAPLKPATMRPYLPPEPLLTRAEVPMDGPPAWKHFAVKVTQGLMRGLLQEAESHTQRSAVLRANTLRSHPIYALTWDPPLMTISIRTLSRDDYFFPKRFYRGVAQSSVNIPRRTLSRALRQINDLSAFQSGYSPLTRSPVGVNEDLDTAIATPPSEQPEDWGPQRIKVSLPRSHLKGTRGIPQIRLPRAGGSAASQATQPAPATLPSTSSSPFQTALNAATGQAVLGASDVRRAPGSRIDTISAPRNGVVSHSADFSQTAGVLGTSSLSVATRTREEDSPTSYMAHMELTDMVYSTSDSSALGGAISSLPEPAVASGQTSVGSTLPLPKSTASPWGFPMLEGSHSAPDSDAVKKVWAQPSSDGKNGTQNSLKGITDAFLPSSLVQDLRNEEAPPLSASSVDSHRASDTPLDDFGTADSVFNPHAMNPASDVSGAREPARGSPVVRQNGFAASSSSISTASGLNADVGGNADARSVAKAGAPVAGANRFAAPGVAGYETASFGPADYPEAYASYGYFPYSMTPQQMNAFALQQRQYNAAALQFGTTLTGASPYGGMSPMAVSTYNAFRPPSGAVGKGYYSAGMSSGAFGTMGAGMTATVGWPVDSHSQSPHMAHAAAAGSNYSCLSALSLWH